MKNVLIVVGVVVLIALGVVGFIFFRPPQEASAPIEALPLDLASPTPEEEESTEGTTDNGYGEAETTPDASSTAEPTETTGDTGDTAEPTASDAEPAAGEPLLFEIVPAESQARFLIDEVLQGDPITVVGNTDQVAGQIAIDPNDPTASQVGTIQVNARTITTDNEFRNRAIKNVILQTDAHEFVTFVPTNISGLPESGSVGESYTLQITGDLTVAGTTNPITFDATVTPVSEERIEGNASASLLYTDFNLFIPDSPSVDTVADEVRLELDFVAERI